MPFRSKMTRVTNILKIYLGKIAKASKYKLEKILRHFNRAFLTEIPLSCYCDIPSHHMTHAQTLWDYLKLGHNLQKSDLILVLGNHDIRTAEFACHLWKENWAPKLMFSGNEGNLTKEKWNKPEAEIFYNVAMKFNIPPEFIVLETEATNTGENISKSYEILKKTNNLPSSVILVQMPMMERRTYATFLKQWPQESPCSVCITSPNVTMLQYANEDVGDFKKQIEIMMGCMWRIIKYPELGYQEKQDIPDCVMYSYQELLKLNLYNDLIS